VRSIRRLSLVLALALGKGPAATIAKFMEKKAVRVSVFLPRSPLTVDLQENGGRAAKARPIGQRDFVGLRRALRSKSLRDQHEGRNRGLPFRLPASSGLLTAASASRP
jgi:hypothetical protein